MAIVLQVRIYFFSLGMEKNKEKKKKEKTKKKHQRVIAYTHLPLFLLTRTSKQQTEPLFK